MTSRGRWRLGIAAVALSLAACRKDPEPSEAGIAGFDAAAELRAFAGTWEPGMDSETGCTWTVRGARLDRTCGAKIEAFTVRILGPTQLALEREGGWERFAYARDGADLYVGRGSSGRRIGDTIIADGTNFRVVMTPAGCLGYSQLIVIGGRTAEARFDDAAIPITCRVDGGTFRYEAPVYVVSSGMQLSPQQLDFMGDALVDGNVRGGRLRPIGRPLLPTAR